MKILYTLIAFSLFSFQIKGQSITATAGTANVVTTGNDTWLNSGNATGGDDDIYTSVINMNDQQESHQLNLSNFGIVIPNGATIDGVEVTVEWYACLLYTSDAADE